MEDETLQDALDYCLFNPDELEMEELLAKFPESREELAPMLALCGLISEAVPPVPQERRDAMRDRIQEAALARQQAMSTTSNGHHEGAVAATLPVLTVEPSPQPAARPVKLPGKVRVEEDRPRRSFLADWFRRPAFAAAAFAALLLAFIWGLSASALPNNPFYNVKLLGESIALNMQTSPEGKVLKHNELANIRLREIEEMDRRGDLDQAGGAFDNYAEHLREGQEILSGTQFTEQQQSRLARALYATSTTGEIKLAGLDDDIAGMPEKVQESLSESKQLQRQVRNYSAHVLEDLGEEPLSTLSPEAQDALKQTPGPEATALANFGSETAEPGPSATRASSSPTSLGSGSGDDATATRTATSESPPDRTATYVASNLLANPSATSTSSHSSTATQTSVAASPTRTATSVAVATSTPTARSEASPLASTPTPTTRPGNGATVTPPRGKPTETRRPESTRTPGRPPTHTPRPEKTKEKGDDSTATPVSTSTYPPTQTPVPPSNTPVPTNTFVPTETPTERPDSRPATHTPKPKELPTDTVEPTREPTREPTEEPSEPSKPVSVCDVNVNEVSVGCGSGGCIEWSAQLVNKATEAMEVNWAAEMQVEVAGAAPATYRESGTVLVRPGEESISGRFCESMPELTKKVRVVVRTDTGGANCDSSKQRTIDPCESDEQDESKPTEEPKPTRQPEPTKEPGPTEEPKPTEKPKPTEEPEPTREPQSTIIPLPTLELFPTRTPKPK
ncbi:MAG TPA: DUF5667 domain-containing protein [Chloroflexia bacterium]|jgi:hypothetical protein